MRTPVTLETALKRDKVVIVACLILATALAWLHLRAASHMTPAGAAELAGGPHPLWAAGALGSNFLMWSVMMIAMMLPSAAPAIVLYASIVRKNRGKGPALPSAWTFCAGYIAVWTGFALAATILQTGLQSAGLLSPMMRSADPVLTGALLIVAGVYQLSPAKSACLRRCRAPMRFLLFHWREGSWGAFRMGAEHGLFCVGCCWALMLLLFAAGVMNLLWVALIAGFVLLEKVAPGGRGLGRFGGIALIAAGVGALFEIL